MCEPLVVKNVTIGEGKPKICVPITGATMRELERETRKVATYPSDLIEWRVDCFESYQDIEAVRELLDKIHARCPEKPLIFTLRTKSEGGFADMTGEAFYGWIREFYDSESIDIIDVQLNHGPVLVDRLISEINKAGKKVILSYHDFDGTPSKEEMLTLLEQMDKTEADILKMAVMPNERNDVISLLHVTVDMAEKTKKPLVTMSMGKAGVLSRLIGEMTGSVITFAVGEKASAPGQISAGALEEILELLHETV